MAAPTPAARVFVEKVGGAVDVFQVMAGSGSATTYQVTWPGGSRTFTSLAAAREWAQANSSQVRAQVKAITG